VSIGAAALCTLLVIEGGLLLLVHTDAAYTSCQTRSTAISAPLILTNTHRCSKRQQSDLPCYVLLADGRVMMCVKHSQECSNDGAA
jgi:hypothetical protein